MKCTVCNSTIEGAATYLHMQNASDKYLNRDMALCEICAYSVLEHLYAHDPMCGKVYLDELNIPGKVLHRPTK